MKMYTLGHDFIPPAIHAGGLRYHGAAPLVSGLLRNSLISARAFDQSEIYQGALLFAKTEGIIPAPESGHAFNKLARHAKKEKKR